MTLALGFGQHPEEAAQWSTDGWRTTHDDPTRDTGLGVHVVERGILNMTAHSQVGAIDLKVEAAGDDCLIF